jgi:peptidoglycan/xylan/chitin deacetylase (PgdA/CDA1 family)
VPAQRVLGLHGIGSPHSCATDDERFYWLSREKFNSLLQTIVATRETSNPPVVITFDDGNESDALIALPELVKRNLKAIFFVVGGRIGLPHYLDCAALRDVVSAGMEIGSHGMHHCDWRKLESTMLHVEVDASRRRIEDVAGEPSQKLQFPLARTTAT